MNYQATRNPDGTLVIHSVPIFVECERGGHAFDGEWIATAVRKAKQAEAEGYLPPLHVRHHEDGPSDTVKAAGFFRILGTQPITFKGKRRMAVLADLTITDPGVSADVLAKRLPYRSVEIFNVEQPALDSLALLDHEAPYLELPMLMVADVQDQHGATVVDTHTPGDQGLRVAHATFANPWLKHGSRSADPVVACFRRGASAHVLMQGDTMNTEQMTQLNFKEMDYEKTPEEGKSENMPKDKEEGADMQDEGGLDVKSVVKAIEDGSISIADMDAILVAIQAQKGGEAAEVETEVEEMPAPAAAPGSEAMSQDVNEEVARLKGRLAAQEAKLRERDEAEARREAVGAAMSKLSNRGLGADLENRLAQFHQDNGPKAFSAFVDEMHKCIAEIPESPATMAAFMSQTSKVPQVALKYQSDGTDAVDTAARFAREWQDLHERGHVRMSQERYVELNMNKN